LTIGKNHGLINQILHIVEPITTFKVQFTILEDSLLQIVGETHIVRHQEEQVPSVQNVG